MQPKIRIQPDRNTELWLGMPKNGRTLGVSQQDFLKAAGIITPDRQLRIDNYILTKYGENQPPLGIRGFNLKPQMAIGYLSTGRLDCALLGKDIVKEFNLSFKNNPDKKGLLQLSTLIDLDISRCVLTIAVKENDPAFKPRDLNGRNIVTKYPNLLARWATLNNVQFGNIITQIVNTGDLCGGIEESPLFNPSVTVIADIVQSGESLVRYGWKPLGMKEKDWAPIRQSYIDSNPAILEKFCNLSSSKLDGIAGVILRSNTVLVGTAAKKSDSKINAQDDVRKLFYDAATQLSPKDTQPWDMDVKPLWIPRRLNGYAAAYRP